jgi:Domain of unknown function (DUF4145)
MAPFHWTCPYCNRDTTIQSENYDTDHFDLTIANAEGTRRFVSQLIVCPNPKCKRFELKLFMHNGILYTDGSVQRAALMQTWNLIPPSAAKPMPDYVPLVIRDDYEEACLIRDLSPKSSATLARRALQGMIRDFWKISNSRLIDEINALRDKVDPLTWQAIDGVRSVGNIGAHMEKDINVVIDVEPDEADKLIHLIEILVRDWYVTRHDREERLKSVVDLKTAKENEKQVAKSEAANS